MQRYGEGIEITRDGKKFQVKYYKDQIIRRQFIGSSGSTLEPSTSQAQYENERVRTPVQAQRGGADRASPVPAKNTSPDKKL